MSLQVGDFITLAMLATRAFQALDSSRGSKFEFISLLGSLKALSQAMLQAEALCVGCYTSCSDDSSTESSTRNHLDSIVQDIVKAREECETLITQFLKSFASYDEAFSDPRSMIRQSFRKLTYLGRKDEAAVLEKRLNAHLRILQLRLCAFC